MITRWVLFVKQTRVRFPLLYVELLGIRNLLLVPCPVQEYIMVKWKKRMHCSCVKPGGEQKTGKLAGEGNTLKSFRKRHNPLSITPGWFLWLPTHPQFRSVAQLCPTLCGTMNRSTSGLPVHHQLPEFTQTHIHRVSDAIQPSHPLSSPSPPAPNPSQHQSLFQWVNSSHEVAKVLEFQL